MENIIEYLKSGSTTVQALGITAGGLIGVFATLTVFFLLIWISVKVGSKR
jgi:hypothetical protein